MISVVRNCLLRAIAIWLVILVCAFVNGALREWLLIPSLDPIAGMVLSGLLLSAVVLIVALLTIRWIGPVNDLQALATGALWLAGTLVFEFGFGLGVQHQPLQQVLAAYTFAGGNLWPLVLLVTLLAPFISRRLRPH